MKEEVLHSEPRDRMATKASSGSAISPASREPVMDLADFLILYASSYGHVAYMDSRGSQMTQAFVKFTNEADTNTTFIKITQKVKMKLQQSHNPQTAESHDRLDKDYFIKRYYSY